MEVSVLGLFEIRMLLMDISVPVLACFALQEKLVQPTFHQNASSFANWERFQKIRKMRKL